MSIVEFCSAVKNNEIRSLTGKQLELEVIVLSERCNSHKDEH